MVRLNDPSFGYVSEKCNILKNSRSVCHRGYDVSAYNTKIECKSLTITIHAKTLKRRQAKTYSAKIETVYDNEIKLSMDDIFVARHRKKIQRSEIDFDNDIIRVEIRQLSIQMNNFKKENEELRKENDKLRESHAQKFEKMENSIKKLKENVKDLKKERESTKEKLFKGEIQIEAINQKVEDLDKSQSKLKQKHGNKKKDEDEKKGGFLGGLVQTVGTAIGGPIGGMVGGAVGNLVDNLAGPELGEQIGGIAEFADNVVQNMGPQE